MSTTPDASVPASALTSAFDALSKYAPGSGRGTLQPIDDAVAAATRDTAQRSALEARLVAVLRGPASVVAKEYTCEKLALIGGPDSTAALADLLSNASLAHAATNALQVMPGAEAANALRSRLSKLDGVPLAGALTALGMRRDTASTEAITEFLASTSATVASAAAAALGEIATVAAAKALQVFLPKAPPPVQSSAANAALVCAEHLKAAGDIAAAKALLDALLTTNAPAQVRAAASRILA